MFAGDDVSVDPDRASVVQGRRMTPSRASALWSTDRAHRPRRSSGPAQTPGAHTAAWITTGDARMALPAVADSVAVPCVDVDARWRDNLAEAPVSESSPYRHEHHHRAPPYERRPR